MSSGNRRHRGPKSARCSRAASSSRKSTSSTTSVTSARSSNRSSSSESSVLSEGPSIRSSRSIGSCISVGAVCEAVAPDLTFGNGDRKTVYELSDKGKMVMINRTDGSVVYMLRCVDGRRVYIEKTKESASLILTNQRGQVTKAIAAEY